MPFGTILGPPIRDGSEGESFLHQTRHCAEQEAGCGGSLEAAAPHTVNTMNAEWMLGQSDCGQPRKVHLCGGWP